MGKVIRVTPEELETSSTKLGEYSETYLQISNQLMMQAETMSQAWEGDDNLAFVNQIKGFTEELKMMSDKLKTASDVLLQQKNNYSTRQQNNIDQVKQLAN
jgi:WXG100 family type VII secretion target